MPRSKHKGLPAQERHREKRKSERREQQQQVSATAAAESASFKPFRIVAGWSELAAEAVRDVWHRVTMCEIDGSVSV
jgi:hypothetical protein